MKLYHVSKLAQQKKKKKEEYIYEEITYREPCNIPIFLIHSACIAVSRSKPSSSLIFCWSFANCALRCVICRALSVESAIVDLRDPS